MLRLIVQQYRLIVSIEFVIKGLIREGKKKAMMHDTYIFHIKNTMLFFLATIVLYF